VGWRVQRLDRREPAVDKRLEDSPVMDEDSIDVDQQTTDRVIVSWLQVRQGFVWNLRKNGLPLGARPFEVGERRVSVRRDQLVKLCCCSQAPATASASWCWIETCEFMVKRSAVVSLASMALSTLFTSSLAAACRRIGITLSAFSRCLSSCRTTRPSELRSPSLLKTRPRSIDPFLKAALVAGPSVSRALNDLKCRL